MTILRSSQSIADLRAGVLQRSPAAVIMLFMAAICLLLAGAAHADDDDDEEDDDDDKGHYSQTITFAAIANRAFSTVSFTVAPTSSSKLPVSVASLTPTICTASGSYGRTITMLRSGVCTLNATQKGDDDYRAATPVSRSFNISLAPQTITFAPIADRPLSTTPFTVAPTSSVGLVVAVTSLTPSVCTATGTAGRTITTLAAGVCTLRATQPGDTRYQAATPVERSFAITIVRGAQSISFSAIASRPYSSVPFTVSAASSAGLAVDIASTTPAICSTAAAQVPTSGAWAHAVTMLATGTCTLQATQAGDASFNAATPVQQSFVISKAEQSISFAPLPARDLALGSFTAAATASSGLPVALSSSTPSTCTTSGSTVTLLAVGTCTLSANQVGNNLYNAAPNVSQSFAIQTSVRPQAITSFNPPSSVVYAPPPDNTLSLSAVGGASGNPVTFTTTTPLVCTVGGSVVGAANQSAATLTIVAAGICGISAAQAGSAGYTPAPTVTANIVIEKASQTITGLSAPTSLTYALAPNNTVALTAQGGTSGNPVVFASTTSSVCTTSGTNRATLTILSVGICTLTADQAGNENYNAAPQVTSSITVNKSKQTISGFSPPASITYAGAPNNTLTLTAQGGASGNPVVLASTTSSVCTTSGTNGATLTILSAGTCNLTLDQAGNENYNPAPQVTSSITVNKASQAITGFNPPATISQSAGSTLTLTATGGASGNPVTFSTTTPSVCTTGGTNGVTLTVRSAGNCSATANQAGNDNYSAALPVTVTISIAVPAQLYFIHADHLGTPRAITKASDNTKVWEWKNDDPFGNNTPDENPNGANTSAFKYNLRFPGQYLDEETNTHYNYFRDYEPSTGRYVQSDPIGLKGGQNTFSYVDNSPLSAVDMLGLESYQCRRPLKQKPGDKQRNLIDVVGNPLYHQYSCTRDVTGKLVCGGQGLAGNGMRGVPDWLTSPGKPTSPKDDYYNPASCEKSQPDNKCFEKCLIDEWAKPRPRYGIPFGTDCQEYDDDVNARCRKKCGLK